MRVERAPHKLKHSRHFEIMGVSINSQKLLTDENTARKTNKCP